MYMNEWYFTRGDQACLLEPKRTGALMALQPSPKSLKWKHRAREFQQPFVKTINASVVPNAIGWLANSVPANNREC